MLEKIRSICKESKIAIATSKTVCQTVQNKNQLTAAQSEKVKTSFQLLEEAQQKLDAYPTNIWRRFIRWLFAASLMKKIERRMQALSPYKKIVPMVDPIAPPLKNETEEVLEEAVSVLKEIQEKKNTLLNYIQSKQEMWKEAQSEIAQVNRNQADLSTLHDLDATQTTLLEVIKDLHDQLKELTTLENRVLKIVSN